MTLLKHFKWKGLLYSKLKKNIVHFKSLLLLHLYVGNKVWTMWFSYNFPSIWWKFPFIHWKYLSRDSTLLLYFPANLSREITLSFSFFICGLKIISWKNSKTWHGVTWRESMATSSILKSFDLINYL